MGKIHQSQIQLTGQKTATKNASVDVKALLLGGGQQTLLEAA